MNRLTLTLGAATLGLGLSAQSATAQNMDPNYSNLADFVQAFAADPQGGC